MTMSSRSFFLVEKRGALSLGLDSLSTCIHQTFSPHLLINMIRLGWMGELWASHTSHEAHQYRKATAYLQCLLSLPWALEHLSVQWVLNLPEGLKAKWILGQIPHNSSPGLLYSQAALSQPCPCSPELKSSWVTASWGHLGRERRI